MALVPAVRGTGARCSSSLRWACRARVMCDGWENNTFLPLLWETRGDNIAGTRRYRPSACWVVGAMGTEAVLLHLPCPKAPALPGSRGAAGAGAC